VQRTVKVVAGEPKYRMAGGIFSRASHHNLVRIVREKNISELNCRCPGLVQRPAHRVRIAQMREHFSSAATEGSVEEAIGAVTEQGKVAAAGTDGENLAIRLQQHTVGPRGAVGIRYD